MIVLVALAVLWISYEVANRLRDTVEGTQSRRPTPSRSDPGLGDGDRITRRVTWSALDDHQLTRLLIESASRPTDSHDDVAGH